GLPVQQVVEECKEPLAPCLHLLVTVCGCRTQIGLLLFIQGRGLDHYLEAINQGAVGNHRRHYCLIACHAPLDVIPPFFHTPDVGTTLMMRIGPIEAKHLAAPSLMLGGHESPMAWQPAVAVPACLKDRSVHRSPTRLCSSGPDLGIVDALQRLIGTEDEACHIPLNMLKALCTAEHITIGGQPLMDGGGHPDDRQHSLNPLRGYLLIDSLLWIFAVRLVEGNNFPSGVIQR